MHYIALILMASALYSAFIESAIYLVVMLPGAIAVLAAVAFYHRSVKHGVRMGWTNPIVLLTIALTVVSTSAGLYFLTQLEGTGLPTFVVMGLLALPGPVGLALLAYLMHRSTEVDYRFRLSDPVPYIISVTSMVTVIGTLVFLGGQNV